MKLLSHQVIVGSVTTSLLIMLNEGAGTASISNAWHLPKGPVIGYGEWGRLQNGKIAGPKLVAPPPPRNLLRPPPPPPQERIILFVKAGNCSCPPPFNIAKTSSSCVKLYPRTLSAPPPPLFFLFLVEVNLDLTPPPLLLCSPPPSP